MTEEIYIRLSLCGVDTGSDGDNYYDVWPYNR